MAVNAAIELEKPLLIKGEPGTGKTMLAEQVAESLDMPLIEWPNDDPIDIFSLIFFSDSMTPPVYNRLGSRGWVPSIELTVHIRGIQHQALF